MRTFGHSQESLPGLIDFPQPDPDIYWSVSPVRARMVESATVAYARCGELQDPDGEGVTKWKRLHNAVATPMAMSFAGGPSLYPRRSTALEENDRVGPKYLNTGDTPLFPTARP
jgi:hypothetical protein